MGNGGRRIILSQTCSSVYASCLDMHNEMALIALDSWDLRARPDLGAVQLTQEQTLE